MRILLDSCVVVWMLLDPDRLTDEEKSLILDEENEIFISVATAWELEIKRANGKIGLDDDWKAEIDRNGFTWLGITPTHTEGLRSLPPIHKDPFDRIIVCQAKAEKMRLLSHDANVVRYFPSRFRGEDAHGGERG